MIEFGNIQHPKDRMACCATIHIEPDFCAKFDQNKKLWVTTWKWSGGQTPSTQCQKEYNCELDNGWLQPYTEKELGTPKGLILLMAGVQKNKHKVHLVLDHQELNECLDAHTVRTETEGMV